MKRAGLAVAALVTVLAVVETANALLASSRVATDADWTAAADEVRAGFRPGDLIVVAPAWSDPVARHFLGDLMPVEMIARSDDDAYGRIWELSTRGAHAPDVRGLAAVETHAHGRVTVARYDHAPARRETFDLTAHLADAVVSQGDGARCRPAPQDGDDGFQCASTHVARRTLEIDYRPRRGILVPVDGRRTTRLEWSDVDGGGSLRLYTGLHDYYARKSADGKVHVRVLVDDRPALALDVGNQDAWVRHDVPLAAGKHALAVEVSASRPAWRNLGFHATVGTP